MKKKFRSFLLVCVSLNLIMSSVCYAAPAKPKKSLLRKTIVLSEELKAESAEQEKTGNAEDEYLCFEIDEEVIDDVSYSDLVKKINKDYSEMPAGKTVSQMIINEIYARHGYVFKTKEISKFFEAKSWYEPDTSDMSEITSRLNKTELKNIKYLQSVK